MGKIANLVSADLLILAMPCVSYMLFDFMQDGMIFSRYGKWLETINQTLAKPLGACLKCFHVWVCIIAGIIIGVTFLKFIILLSISYVILVKLFYN